LFAELKGKMGDEKGEKLVSANLDKVIAKITKNQKADGSWANAGWAPVLSQSIAAKGLNQAAQSGAKGDDKVVARTEQNARDNFLPARTTAAAGVSPLGSVGGGAGAGGGRGSGGGAATA